MFVLYLKEAETGAFLYLADDTLSSSRLPPLLTDSQFFVRVYVRTSSGRTGIELTRFIDGKNEYVSFKELFPTIQRFESGMLIESLKKIIDMSYVDSVQQIRA